MTTGVWPEGGTADPLPWGRRAGSSFGFDSAVRELARGRCLLEVRGHGGPWPKFKDGARTEMETWGPTAAAPA